VPPPSAFNGRYPHLPLSAGACTTAPAAVDRYLLPVGRSAAKPPAAAASVDRSDREADGRTDGRTDARSFNRPCTAYGSASKQRHRLTLTVTSDFTTASRKEHTRCSSTVINHCPAVEWLLAAFKRHYALRLAIAPEFFYCSYMCLMFALGC